MKAIRSVVSCSNTISHHLVAQAKQLANEGAFFIRAHKKLVNEQGAHTLFEVDHNVRAGSDAAECGEYGASSARREVVCVSTSQMADCGCLCQ